MVRMDYAQTRVRCCVVLDIDLSGGYGFSLACQRHAEDK